jgi:hypothetical protein
MLGGLWRADIAEAADGPDEAVDTDCGLAVDMPAIGSDFDVGHNPRAVRFREAQSLVCAPFIPLTPFAPFTPLTPLFWFDAVEMVDVEEVEEDIELSDVEEFERCALFLGMSIRETSSALMLVKPLVGPLEPRHKFGGGATAVICRYVGDAEAGSCYVGRSFLCRSTTSSPHEHLASTGLQAHDTATTTANNQIVDLALLS